MSRKTATQWAQVHTAFERGEPFSALAKAHNVSHTAIRRRAKTERLEDAQRNDRRGSSRLFASLPKRRLSWRKPER
jgi:hypothetical protein